MAENSNSKDADEIEINHIDLMINQQLDVNQISILQRID